MNEAQARAWMKELAGETCPTRMPEAEFLWARALLEAEFERRQKAARPLFWMEVALRTGAVVAVVVTVAGLMGA